MADQEMSKSAKRRAAKKARDAAAATVAEAEQPAPVEVKSKTPAAPAAAAAKAQPKAEAKAAAKAEPKAAAKAEGKAKAKADAKVAPAPASKEAPAKAKEPPAPVKEEPQDPFAQFDDGTGDSWEVAKGSNKKDEARKAKKAADAKAKEEKEAAEKAAEKVAAAPTIAGKPNNKGGPAKPVAATDVVRQTMEAARAAGAQARAEAAAAARVDAETEDAAAGAKSEHVTDTVNVPEGKIGIVIGPKGSKIKMIQEKTNVARIDTSGEIFTLVGKPDCVAKAKKAVEDLVEKGYCELTYDNFGEGHVMVHASCVPDIVGKQGSVIRKIKDELNVEVHIPPQLKDTKPQDADKSDKKYKVTIAGAAEGVDKAKEVINSIMMHYHHEITHPGEVHEEMEVEDWMYSFIIGKGGCEMKHVQNSYKVRMYIPKDHSLNKKVVIVGDKDSVERAKAYVEKQIEKAATVAKGRDAKKDEGMEPAFNKDDGEEEDWMKRYMYNRKK